jgi:Ca-activated chloride channel family protein
VVARDDVEELIMDIQIGNQGSIWLLAVVATGLVLTTYGIVARHRAALRFATARVSSMILPSGTASRHWMSAILIATSMSLLCVSLMDVRWGKTWREVPQKGIEVMFVLDVSRSMLAEDASPNRLGRAKQQIKDIVDEMAGDRVGLIVFAGEPRQSVPMTSHYEDFKQTLDFVGPHTVRVGGSRLGDALTAAANGFLSKTNNHKAIVVFTDGEDQESKPDEVAQKMHAEKGIRIFTVGLGDIERGARIPESNDNRGGFVQYEGQQVWSKMNGEILSRIATDTDGAYIPAGTRRVNMADVYHGYIANVEQTEFETARINAYIARYHWFAVPALVLLLLEVWITTQHARPHGRLTPQNSSRSQLKQKRATAVPDQANQNRVTI